MPLDLAFTTEQDMLRELVRGVCSQYASLDVVRQMEDDPTGYPAELWKQLGSLDLLGLLIPEEYGGSGMTALEGVVLYEEFGRALAPTPHFVSCVLSAGVLLAGDNEAARAEWIPRIVTGDAILTPAWLEPENGFGPAGIHVRAEGGRITGTKRHVFFASSAARLVVVARSGDDDIGLFLIDPAADGVTLTQQHSVASDTQYRIDFDNAEGERIGGWPAWTAVVDDALILLAAEAVGGAMHAQEITVQYAKDREQFDKPLGAFQAIAHYLADRQTELDGARTLVHEAAWARATGRSVTRLAPMAKLFASKVFRDLTATSQQIFGGVGFTLDYEIQLYFRRAKSLQIGWWNDRYLEDLIAADVLD